MTERVCSECKYSLKRSCFSKNQLKKKEEARCKKCIQRNLNRKICFSCHRSIDLQKFSNTQRRKKGRGSCMKCVERNFEEHVFFFPQTIEAVILSYVDEKKISKSFDYFRKAYDNYIEYMSNEEYCRQRVPTTNRYITITRRTMTHEHFIEYCNNEYNKILAHRAYKKNYTGYSKCGKSLFDIECDLIIRYNDTYGELDGYSASCECGMSTWRLEELTSNDPFPTEPIGEIRKYARFEPPYYSNSDSEVEDLEYSD